ncbi:hypothetical protein R6Q57_013212 [Mikania cordata]
MDSIASEGVYPLHRSKTIHLVRHAQGVHNVAGEKDHSAYMSEELFDAHLYPSWLEADNLRKHVHASGLSKKVELVVVSPLLRLEALTVVLVGLCKQQLVLLEVKASVDGIDVPLLMAENTGSSNRPAISSLNCPPFIAVELCREHLGVHPCDRRRSISEYKPMFPAIDFSLIENDGDVLWTTHTRERNEDVAARGAQGALKVQRLSLSPSKKQEPKTNKVHSVNRPFLAALDMF